MNRRFEALVAVGCFLGCILMVAVALLSGCSPRSPDGEAVARRVEAHHDAQRGVTCWRTWNGSGSAVALSCLPDSQLRDGGAP